VWTQVERLVVDDYYIKQTDDEGVETYESVDAVTVDDETFFADPRYKKVADRDANRRARVKELNKRVKEFEALGEEDVDVTPPPEEEDTPAPVMTTEEIVAAAVAEIDKRAVDAALANTEQQATLTGLVDKHKLGKEALAILATSTDPEATAELLGKSSLRFDDTAGGTAPGQITDLEGAVGNVLTKLGLDD